MHIWTKLTFASMAGAGVASLVLWWLADHRRGMAWAVSFMRRRFPDVSHLSPLALDAWLRDRQRPTPQILDARSEEEFAVSHLAGARRIDDRSTASMALSGVDSKRAIVIYCSAGYRAARLVRRLQKHKRGQVWNLEGGIFAWANAGLPVEKEGQITQRLHPYWPLFTRLLKRPRSD